MVEGHKYQGRPKKRRVDNNFILKWCNMTLQEKSHHAQNHVKWRTFIAGPYGSWTTGQEEEEEEGNPYLTPSCTGLLESRGSGLGLPKSTFNAENFMCRLSWSIFSHFGPIHSWNACCSPKSRKIHYRPKMSVVTMLLSAAIWPQFAMQSFYQHPCSWKHFLFFIFTKWVNKRLNVAVGIQQHVERGLLLLVTDVVLFQMYMYFCVWLLFVN